MFEPVCEKSTEPTTEPLPERICGDVDANGTFEVADIIMMQKHLLCLGALTDRQAGDLYADEIIDMFELALMKRKLISS